MNCANRNEELVARLSTARAAERGALVKELCSANIEVAEAIARRYARHAYFRSDLEQVACLALVQAARDFDTGRGQEFLEHAVPCMTRAVKHYYGDSVWAIRPARHVRARHAKRAGPAGHLVAGADIETCFRPRSPDNARPGHLIALGSAIADERDGTWEGPGVRLPLQPHLKALPSEARRLLYGRYVEDRTRQELADDLGVSTTDVSRLLWRYLRELRDTITAASRGRHPLNLCGTAPTACARWRSSSSDDSAMAGTRNRRSTSTVPSTRHEVDGHMCLGGHFEACLSGRELSMGDAVVTKKDDFTDDEWERIVRAPFVAGLAVSLADPGSPVENAEELRAMIEAATRPASQEELVLEVSSEIQADVVRNTNPLEGYRPAWPGTAPSGEQALIELRAVREIVETRATARESLAFAGWLVDAATATAGAAREKGFLGIGGGQVSHAEMHILEQIRAAVSLD